MTTPHQHANPSPLKVLGGFATGIAMQLTLPFMALFALLSAWGATAGEDIHSGSTEPDAWILVTCVLLALMAATYVGSGWVAAKVMGSNIGWLILFAPAFVLAILSRL